MPDQEEHKHQMIKNPVPPVNDTYRLACTCGWESAYALAEWHQPEMWFSKHLQDVGQANYENSPQTERVRAPESIEKVVQQYVGAELRVFIDPLVPDGTAYVMPDDFGDQLRVTQSELEAMPSWRERYREILAELPEAPGQAKISITAAEHPDHARMSPSQQKYYLTPEQLAQRQAARREIEDQVAAEFRPRSDEAADLHDRYLLLKGEPIGAIWKAGWAERLVDAVRQMELDPPEDQDLEAPTLSELATELAKLRAEMVDDLHEVWAFDGSMAPQDVAECLIEQGWRR